MEEIEASLDESKSKPKGSARRVFFPWLICGLAACFYFYEYFLRISPSVMTQELMRTYHIDAATLGNLAAFYYYAYTPMQLPVGMLMDRYGPRLLLTLACLSCAFGTYLFATSNYILMAECGRFLIGFGSAFAFVGVLKLATIWLPPERFALISGLSASLGTLGAMTGDVSLTALVRFEGWRTTIMMSAVAGLILAFIIVLIVRNKDESFIGPTRQDSPTNMKEMVSGLKYLLKRPQVWVVSVLGLLLYLPTPAFAELWGIPYLEQARHFSNEDAAFAISALFLGWGMAAPIAGWVSDKIKKRRMPMILGAMGAALTISAILYLPHLSKTAIFVLLFIFGMFYSVQAITFAVGRENSPAKSTGTVLAFVNMFAMMGGILFQPVIGVLLDLDWHGTMMQGARVFSTGDFKMALSILPISLILAVIVGFFVKETGAKSFD